MSLTSRWQEIQSGVLDGKIIRCLRIVNPEQDEYPGLVQATVEGKSLALCDLHWKKRLWKYFSLQVSNHQTLSRMCPLFWNKDPRYVNNGSNSKCIAISRVTCLQACIICRVYWGVQLSITFISCYTNLKTYLCISTLNPWPLSDPVIYN